MLTLNWNIIWVIVNLLILFVLLRIFLFRPVLDMMEKRQQTIKDSLDEAEKKNAEADQRKEEYEASLKKARLECAEIIQNAEKQAQVQYDQMIDKANQDASQILRQANLTAQSERAQMMRDAQAELADIALTAASRLLENSVDEKANREILDGFLDQEAGKTL